MTPKLSARDVVFQYVGIAHALYSFHLLFQPRPKCSPCFWVLRVRPRLAHSCPGDEILMTGFHSLKSSGRSRRTFPLSVAPSADVAAQSCVNAPYERSCSRVGDCSSTQFPQLYNSEEKRLTSIYSQIQFTLRCMLLLMFPGHR